VRYRREEKLNNTFKLGSSSSKKTINPAADDDAGRKEEGEGAHGEEEANKEVAMLLLFSREIIL
jgi:hypothetical protein